MRNLKKVLALVLALAMSLSVVAFAGTVYPDVADDATYAEATTILKSLGIMKGDDQGNFNPDKTVTRGEMATILCNIAGVGAQAPVDTGFADATAAHWASGYIAYAKNAGWINGYSATAFGPDDVVKYEQAIKLVMSVANWGVYADENGGYPAGWLMAAAEAGVTKAGAAGSVGEDCTRAKIAMILYYALDVNVMKQTAFGDKKWEIIEGETVLSKNLDTYKVEGKVINSYKLDADYDEGYVDFAITKTNKIDVEEKLGANADLKLINIKAANAADLLGYSSVAYVNVNEDDEVSIVAIAAKGSKNKVYEITDMDLIYNASKDASERASRLPNFIAANGDYKFSFWNDRDEDSVISYVEIDPTVIFVYNNEIVASTDVFGKSVADALAEIVPAEGTIKMVDTDNDGDIDLFETKSFRVGVVDSVNVAKEKIYFKAGNLGSSITFDTEVNANLKEVTIYSEDGKLGIEDIAENDVLTVSTNSDKTYYDIIVTRAKVEGKVTSVKGVDTVYINGEEYETLVGLTLNKEGVFYLAANGKIVYFDDQTVASTNYAVVDKLGKDSMGGVSIRLFALDGTTSTLNVAEKVKINGVKVALEAAPAAADLTKMGLVATGAATYYDLLVKTVAGEINVVNASKLALNKLVTYDVSNDLVDEITFAKVSTAAGEFGYVNSVADVEWQAANSRFKSSKTLSDKTVIFNLAGTADDWKVLGAADLIDENTYTPYYFANQEDGTAGLVVIFDSKSNINQDASLAFFVDYRTGLYEVNGDEEDVYYVTYYIDGALAEEALPVYDDKYVSMTAGQAFLFAKDEKGIADKIVKVFNVATGTASAFTGDLDDFMMFNGADKDDNEIFYGVLVKAAGGKLTVANIPAAGATSIASDAFENVAVADTAKVLQFKTYGSTNAKKFDTCESILDLEISAYNKVSGTSDIKLDADADLTYVFFRMNNGVVTEVVGVDTAR